MSFKTDIWLFYLIKIALTVWYKHFFKYLLLQFIDLCRNLKGKYRYDKKTKTQERQGLHSQDVGQGLESRSALFCVYSLNYS